VISMAPKTKTNWNNARAVRRYHRLWTRQHRQALRQSRLADLSVGMIPADDLGAVPAAAHLALFARAWECARRAHAALPRDPVLDGWRVQKILRSRFDTRGKRFLRELSACVTDTDYGDNDHGKEEK